MKDRIGSVGAMYVYFNNDISGHAVNNARTLRHMLGLHAPV